MRLEHARRTRRPLPLANQRLLLTKTAELARKSVFAVQPPYCPWSVARWLGVPIEEKHLEGIDGYVDLHDESAPRIVLAKNVQRQRMRFTLAHELGHIILIKNCQAGRKIISNLPRFRTQKVSSTFLEDPVEERLCNHFAAELLMPLSDVREFLGRREIQPDTVIALGRVFNVSLSAGARRLRALRGQRFGVISLWSSKPWLVPVWMVGDSPKRLLDSLELALARGDAECYVEEGKRTLKVDILRLPRADKVLTVATEIRSSRSVAGQLMLPIPMSAW